jgi:hypothetical protein
MRASKNELPKTMEDKSMVMREAVRGDMHVEKNEYWKMSLLGS